VGWLDDIVVLATGAGSGIGRAVVDAFVKEGAKVGVLELMPEKAERLRSELGDSVVVVEGDATILGDNERAVDATVASFGRIDVLSTFVGVFDFFHYLRDMPKEKVSDGFDEIFTTNVKSNVLSVKAALGELEKAEVWVPRMSSGRAQLDFRRRENSDEAGPWRCPSCASHSSERSSCSASPGVTATNWRSKSSCSVTRWRCSAARWPVRRCGPATGRC